MSDKRPNGFLPFKVTPISGDRLLLSPAYIFPVNIMERGLFMGVKLEQKSVIADASNGRITLCRGDIHPIVYTPDESLSVTELPVKITERCAFAMAEMMAVPDEARGWKRSFHASSLLFKHDEFKFLWHLYIARKSELIDSFTGESSGAAGVIDILLGKSDDEGGSSQL
ncbi:MAG: hypothetical protein RRY12_00955 [Cloacibacillus sp.]